MKRIRFGAGIVASTLLISCDVPGFNSSDAITPRYLSSVTRNGKLLTQYEYNADKTVNQIITYDSTGKITSVSSYLYVKGRPATNIVTNYPDTTKGTRYENVFNGQGYVTTRTQYSTKSIDSSKIQFIYTYGYTPDQRYNRLTYHDKKDSALLSIAYAYGGPDVVQETVFTSNGSLMGTMNIQRDNQNNPSAYLSTALTNSSPHNILSFNSTSPAPDSNGLIWYRTTTIGFGFTALSSTFTYDAQGWPLVEIRTTLSKKPKIDTLRYDYISN